MQATTPPAESVATSLSSPLAPLPARMSIQEQLASRGVLLHQAEDERIEAFQNRMGTALMALYRDTRCSEAFEALYGFTRPAVQQWIRGLLHRGLSHLDPQELLQDTFVNVYRYPAGFRDDHAGSFRVWVRTIAGNIVRRASAARLRGHFQELPEGGAEPEDRCKTPATQCVANEARESLNQAWLLLLAHYAKAWEQLSPRDQETLHLVEVQGMSYVEAGAELKVGRSNMKMIVFRARKRIARLIRQAMNVSVVSDKVEAA